MMSGNSGENPREAIAFFGIFTVLGVSMAFIFPVPPSLSLMRLWSRRALWSEGLTGQVSSSLEVILGANKGTLGTTPVSSLGPGIYSQIDLFVT